MLKCISIWRKVIIKQDTKKKPEKSSLPLITQAVAVPPVVMMLYEKQNEWW